MHYSLIENVSQGGIETQELGEMEPGEGDDVGAAKENLRSPGARQPAHIWNPPHGPSPTTISF